MNLHEYQAKALLKKYGMPVQQGIIANTDHIMGSNIYHVVWGPGVSESARLDGFTITGGQGDANWPHNSGGGMFVGNGSPTLRKSLKL